jgi:hypothetical protein
MWDKAAAGLKHHSRWVILLGLVFLNLALHIPFSLIDTLGEQDAGRLVIASIEAAYLTSGTRYTNHEPIYSAPLYAEALRAGILSGLMSPATIIAWMTLASLLASAIATAMLYLFVLNLTQSVWAAAGAGLLLQLVPAFWFNSIYGFPTMLAISFFLVSLVMFQIGLKREEPGLRMVLFGGAFIFFLLAVLTKIDALLAAAIFCLPVWESGRPRRARVLWIGALIIAALVCLLVYALVTRSLLVEQTAPTFYRNWGSKFPLQWRHFFTLANAKILLRTAGLFSIPLGVIAFLLLVRERRYRAILFWLLMSAMPLVLFWGFRASNSARHNLIPGLFLVVLLALPLATHRRKLWSLVLALVCVANYFILAPDASTVAPSGRLFASSRLLLQSAASLHQRGRIISEFPEARIAVVGNGSAQPYYLFEIYRNGSLSLTKRQIPQNHPYTITIFDAGGQEKTYLWSYETPASVEIVKLAERGYFVLIDDPEVAMDLYRFQQMANRFLPISEVDRFSP